MEFALCPHHEPNAVDVWPRGPLATGDVVLHVSHRRIEYGLDADGLGTREFRHDGHVSVILLLRHTGYGLAKERGKQPELRQCLRARPDIVV